MTKIYNVTQHKLTQAQFRDGVVELPVPGTVRELLTFITKPTESQINIIAGRIVTEVKNQVRRSELQAVMIAGAPYLMPALVREFHRNNIDVYFSYNERNAKEVHNEDGSVTLTYEFNHGGLIHFPHPEDVPF